MAITAPSPRKTQTTISKGFWDWIPLLDRYIIAEMLGPFLFGVGAFSSIGVSIGILFDLVRKVTESGLPLAIALQVFGLKLPEFLSLAFPMSMLLSALMAYSRLSNDSEIIALRSCGVSIYRLITPAIILSVFVTVLMFVFNESIVPIANYQATVTLDRALHEEKLNFQDKNILYQQFSEVEESDGTTSNALARIFYARRFDGERMKDVTILDFTRGNLDQILSAETAFWNPKANAWDFQKGTIYSVATDGSYSNIITFTDYQLNLPRVPLDLASRTKDYGEMNIAEATAELRLLTDQNVNVQRIRKLRVRLQEKLALPFVCIVFGVVGAALGTLPNQRTNRATAFGVSILIIFTYYLISFITSALGVREVISPVLSAWSPIGFGAIAGGLLVVRSAR
jgi:lipopolysaccharide export system permease protein